MANHYYIISEVQFYKDKDNEEMWNFILGTGINLNEKCTSKMPTLREIVTALIDFGFVTKEKKYHNERIELSAIKGDKEGVWFIFTDFKDYDTQINMFEVGRGSDTDLMIDFMKFLANSHGNFLYYCDSGAMSLITKDKDNIKITDEMYSN